MENMLEDLCQKEDFKIENGFLFTISLERNIKPFSVKENSVLQMTLGDTVNFLELFGNQAGVLEPLCL